MASMDSITQQLESIKPSCRQLKRETKRILDGTTQLMEGVDGEDLQQIESVIDSHSVVNDRTYANYVKKHVCGVCNQTFNNTSLLAIHKQLQHTGVGLHCPVCMKEFKRSKCLQNHIDKDHNGDQEFSCEKCEEKFRGYNELKNHELNEHAELPAIRRNCLTCSKTFESIAELDLHERICQCMPTPSSYSDMGSKPASRISSPQFYLSKFDLKCPFCDKMFSVTTTRDRHMRRFHLELIHTLSNPKFQKQQSTSPGRRYKCTHEHCTRSFESKAGLNHHLRRHS